MAEITDIRAAGRASHRRRVYLDGEEWVSVPREVVHALGLRVGQTCEPPLLEAAIEEASPGQAWERALRLLNFRDRGSGELRQRLRDDGYPSVVVDDVVERASELGFLDDRRFSEGVARQAVSKRRGRKRVAAELAAKGVDDSLAADVLDAYCRNAAERERAIALAASAGQGSDPVKLAAKLCRAGFETGLAWSVARQVAEGQDDPSDEG